MLAGAAFFAFCSKSDVTSDLKAADKVATSTNRGACLVNVYPLTYATLTYCGTETNTTDCSTCVGDSKGVEVITGDAVLEFASLPTSFSISSATSTSVIVATENNQIGPIAIPANGCIVIDVDGNCVVSN